MSGRDRLDNRLEWPWVKGGVVGIRFCKRCGRAAEGGAEPCSHGTSALVSLAGQLPQAGRILDARYRIDARIADGGVGVVYRAQDMIAAQDVALKLIRPSVAVRSGAVERFLAQAQATTRLKDDRVVRVFDSGVSAEGHPFVAMELLSGRTLAERLACAGRLEPGEALAVARDIALALTHAHSAGVAHLDIKPENVFLARGDDGRIRVKLLDFAGDLASTVAGFAPGPGPGEVQGTPAYMSPEQVGGEIPGPPTDLYALGVVLHEMLSGAPPYAGDGSRELMRAHVRGTLPDLPALPASPEVRRGILALRNRLMASKPDARPGAAEAVVAIDALWRMDLGAAGMTQTVSESPSLAAMGTMDYEAALRAARAVDATSCTVLPFASAMPVPEQAGAWTAARRGEQPRRDDVVDPVTLGMIHVVFQAAGPDGGPMSARRLFAPERAAFREMVVGWGGWVCLDAEAGMRVVFGLGVRDDAPWTPSVRSALDLAQRLERFRRAVGLPVAAGIGVVTDYAFVVPGTMPPADIAIRGPLVDRVVALARAAGPGRILLDDRTRRRLGDAFAFDPAGTIRVQGVQGLERAFEVATRGCAG